MTRRQFTIMFITISMLCISVVININQAVNWNKACELVECYDRVVDTIGEDYFLDCISETDAWRDLENCVERNHLGCGCPKDIMPMVNNE